MRMYLAAAWVFLAAGCSGSGTGGDGADACPLDATERLIVEEVVFEMILNTYTAAEHNVGSERAFGMSLPASTVGNNGFLFDVPPCTTTTSSAPACAAALDPGNPFYELHDACVQLSCESAGVAILDTYFTMQPQQTLEPRHPFTYDTDQPSGTAEFAENPWLRTRVELLGSASNIVTGSFDFDVTVSPDDHDAIPLHHVGGLYARNENLAVTGVELDVTFLDLLDGTGVSAVFLHGTGGSVTSDGTPLATISDEPVPFVWVDGCDG